MAKKVSKVSSTKSTPSAKRVSNSQIKAKTPVSNPQITATRPAANPQLTATQVVNPQLTSAQVSNPQISATGPISNPQITANTGASAVPQLGANSGMPNNINNQMGVSQSNTPQPVSQRVPQGKQVYEGDPINVEGEAPKPKAKKTSKVSTTRSSVKSKSNPTTQEAGSPNFNFFFAGKTPL